MSLWNVKAHFGEKDVIYAIKQFSFIDTDFNIIIKVALHKDTQNLLLLTISHMLHKKHR